jgi:hypothetical protein
MYRSLLNMDNLLFFCKKMVHSNLFTKDSIGFSARIRGYLASHGGNMPVESNFPDEDQHAFKKLTGCRRMRI